MFLSRFWGNARKEGRKEVEFSILRSAIASTSHLKMKKIDKKYFQYLYHTKLAQIPQLLLKNICPCENKRKFTSTKTQLNFYFVELTHFNVGYTHLILIEEIKKENIQIDIYFAVQIFSEHLWPNKKMSQYYVFHNSYF